MQRKTLFFEESASRIGLISDTHIPEAGRELPKQVYEVFEGVDLVLHAGDLHDVKVLDWLERVAPVKAAQGNGDLSDGPDPLVFQDPRIKKTQILEIGGLKIGMIHDFPLSHEVPGLDFRRSMNRLFGGPMDVVVCGHTHIALITSYEDTIVVNSGSPTLPNNVYGSLGTVALMGISWGKPEIEIVQLK